MNPREVEAFRLIGYENRVLAHQDFNDDKKDAGEIGADHTVTALYEIVPAGRGLPVPGTDPLKYQDPDKPSAAATSGELATIKLRYKQPEGTASELVELVVRDSGRGFAEGSGDFRFAASVAELGMLLRSSPYKGKSSYAQVISLASDHAGDERRRELVELARKAERLSGR
jgi:Ca-activated chloride channel family protein